jgi:hypothetical protein
MSIMPDRTFHQKASTKSKSTEAHSRLGRSAPDAIDLEVRHAAKYLLGGRAFGSYDYLNGVPERDLTNLVTLFFALIGLGVVVLAILRTVHPIMAQLVGIIEKCTR